MSHPSDGLFTVICSSCGLSFPAEDLKCSCGAASGDLKLDIDGMLNRIYDLHAKGEDDRALDVVFDVYWNLFAMYDVMNEILLKIDLSKIDEGLMVGFMAQTFKYIKQVPAHLEFCDKAAVRLAELGMTDEEIHDLVDNYRETGNYWESMSAYGAPTWLSGPKPE